MMFGSKYIPTFNDYLLALAPGNKEIKFKFANTDVHMYDLNVTLFGKTPGVDKPDLVLCLFPLTGYDVISGSSTGISHSRSSFSKYNNWVNTNDLKISKKIPFTVLFTHFDELYKVLAIEPHKFQANFSDFPGNDLQLNMKNCTRHIGSYILHDCESDNKEDRPLKFIPVNLYNSLSVLDALKHIVDFPTLPHSAMPPEMLWPDWTYNILRLFFIGQKDKQSSLYTIPTEILRIIIGLVDFDLYIANEHPPVPKVDDDDADDDDDDD